ncbi:hypothetical protein [Radiobacillus deserti]|uniref:Nuclear transport factor 2 family protein n=1 Tax=Radiobacillus deserti TaxID=2594883 RepID=A0A516KJC3_9BACI|nr:hypothetical protein [Radiobacillus deserti]QDP41485.1 hypothetical protein FN924_15665 [Radiobacillus deserti]
MTNNEKDVQAFQKMHDIYNADWDRALTVGEMTTKDRLADSFFIIFLFNNADKPLVIERTEAIATLEQAIQNLSGASRQVQNRAIRFRDSDNVAVFYEQSVEKEGRVLARLFMIEDWQKMDGTWMIVRETMETV